MGQGRDPRLPASQERLRVFDITRDDGTLVRVAPALRGQGQGRRGIRQAPAQVGERLVEPDDLGLLAVDDVLDRRC